MNKHITPETIAFFAKFGLTEVDPKLTMLDLDKVDKLTIFSHAGTATYFAYSPEIVAGMWQPQLIAHGVIAVIGDPNTKMNATFCYKVPLELITLCDLPEFVAQRAFNPAYFDLRIAKQCVTHAQQELDDLNGDYRPTRDMFRKARKKLKEAIKHMQSIAVPTYHPATPV